MKKEGCVVNIDPDWLWYIYESVHADTNDFEEKIRKYVRSYANHGISDLIVCSFSQVSMTPTNVFTWLGEKYEQKIENGIEVDYTNLHRVKHIVDIYKAMDKDPYDIFVDETRKCGMKAWLALRMNDHHYQLEPTCYAHGDMYYKAKENGWFIGKNRVALDLRRSPNVLITAWNISVRKCLLTYVKRWINSIWTVWNSISNAPSIVLIL